MVSGATIVIRSHSFLVTQPPRTMIPSYVGLPSPLLLMSLDLCLTIFQLVQLCVLLTEGCVLIQTAMPSIR